MAPTYDAILAAAASTVTTAANTSSSGADEEGHHEGSPSGSFPFLLFAIFIGAVIRHMTLHIIPRHLKPPYSVLIFLSGMLWSALQDNYGLGTLGNALVSFRNLDPHLILYVFLPPLLFESSFDVDFHVFARQIRQSLTLAGIGVLMSTGLTALCIRYIFTRYEWDWWICLLIGCILSATDPVAVVATLKELGASKKLSTLIEGESLLNDGTAFVLFFIFEQGVKDEVVTVGSVIKDLFQLSFGGPAWGLVAAIVTYYWLKSVFNDLFLEIAILVSAVFTTFYLAEADFHVSGVLAIVTFGLFFSYHGKYAISPEVESKNHAFWSQVSFFMDTLIFTLSGVIIYDRVFVRTNASDIGYDFGMLMILYVVIHVVRFVVVLSLMPILRRFGYGLTMKEGVILVYSGLRGAIGLSLALILENDSNVDDVVASRIMFHVSGIVLLTIFINGSTLEWLYKKLRLVKANPYKNNLLIKALTHLEEEFDIAIEKLKLDWYYGGANWNWVYTTIPNFRRATFALGHVKAGRYNIRDHVKVDEVAGDNLSQSSFSMGSRFDYDGHSDGDQIPDSGHDNELMMNSTLSDENNGVPYTHSGHIRAPDQPVGTELDKLKSDILKHLHASTTQGTIESPPMNVTSNVSLVNGDEDKSRGYGDVITNLGNSNAGISEATSEDPSSLKCFLSPTQEERNTMLKTEDVQGAHRPILMTMVEPSADDIRRNALDEEDPAVTSKQLQDDITTQTLKDVALALAVVAAGKSTMQSDEDDDTSGRLDEDEDMDTPNMTAADTPDNEDMGTGMPKQKKKGIRFPRLSTRRPKRHIVEPRTPPSSPPPEPVSYEDIYGVQSNYHVDEAIDEDNLDEEAHQLISDELHNVFFNAIKSNYHHQFEDGYVGGHALGLLIEAVDTAMDSGSRGRLKSKKLHPNVVQLDIEWDMLVKFLPVPRWVLIFTRFPLIRRVMDLYIYKHLIVCVEIISSFIHAHEMLASEAADFGYVDAESLVEESKRVTKQARRELIRLKCEYPKLIKVIRTVQVTQIMLRVKRDLLLRIKSEGLVDGDIAEELVYIVERELAELKISRPPLRSLEESIGDRSRRPYDLEMDGEHMDRWVPIRYGGGLKRRGSVSSMGSRATSVRSLSHNGSDESDHSSALMPFNFDGGNSAAGDQISMGILSMGDDDVVEGFRPGHPLAMSSGDFSGALAAHRAMPGRNYQLSDPRPHINSSASAPANRFRRALSVDSLCIGGNAPGDSSGIVDGPKMSLRQAYLASMRNEMKQRTRRDSSASVTRRSTSITSDGPTSDGEVKPRKRSQSQSLNSSFDRRSNWNGISGNVNNASTSQPQKEEKRAARSRSLSTDKVIPNLSQLRGTAVTNSLGRIGEGNDSNHSDREFNELRNLK